GYRPSGCSLSCLVFVHELCAAGVEVRPRPCAAAHQPVGPGALVTVTPPTDQAGRDQITLVVVLELQAEPELGPTHQRRRTTRPQVAFTTHTLSGVAGVGLHHQGAPMSTQPVKCCNER